MRLPRGGYVLDLGTTTRWLAVTDDDLEVFVSRGSPTPMYVGLGVAVVGMASMTLGAAEFFHHGFQGNTSCDADCAARHASDSKVWPYLAGAGAIATLGGWILFASSVTTVDIQKTMVAVVPTDGGVAAMFLARF
jgi:hypothetical protein